MFAKKLCQKIKTELFQFRTHEAELSLVQDVLNARQSRGDPLEEVIRQFGDIACFALQILASLYTSTERIPRANEADKRALKLNPLLWKCFESLCKRGDFPDPNVVFNADKLEDLDQCQGTSHVIDYINKVELMNIITQPTTNATTKPSLVPTTPNFCGPRASSTSTPIVPLSSVHLQPIKGQPGIIVTPINQSSEASNSCFTK